MKSLIYLLPLFTVISSWGQCILTTNNLTETQVEGCLTTCGCSEIEIPDGATIYMDQSWDLVDMGPITFTIQGSGGLVFDGNNISLLLSAGSLLIIGDTSNTQALTHTGGQGHVRVQIGSAEYDGKELDEIINSGGADDTDDGTLPVTLAFFTASIQDKTAEITWSTSSEENNDYFTIQRSGDGIVYESIATVPGAGNSASERLYTYVDPNPLYGLSYYRLVQTDFDGVSETFQPQSVYFTTVNKLDVYPNPVNPGYALNIRTGADPEEPLDISIYNFTGRLVRQERLKGDQPMILGGLEPGSYIIKVNSSGTGKSARLVIE